MVKRYNMSHGFGGYGIEPDEQDDGPWVKHEDYATVERERDEALAAKVVEIAKRQEVERERDALSTNHETQARKAYREQATCARAEAERNRAERERDEAVRLLRGLVWFDPSNKLCVPEYVRSEREARVFLARLDRKEK